MNTESGTVNTVVDRALVENLPLNGRSFQTLIALTPGVVVTVTAFDDQGQFSVNGQRADANYFTVDGVSANFGVTGYSSMVQTASGALPALSALGGTNSLVSVDAMQEFRIQTSSFAPEFGRTPGGQISIVTRSGTNAFHGSLFEYFRNNLLDARDWFVNFNGLPKPAERQNDFGGVFGGPCAKTGRSSSSRMRDCGCASLPPRKAWSPTRRPGRRLRPRSNRYLNAFPLAEWARTRDGFAQFNAGYSNPSTLNAYQHSAGSRRRFETEPLRPIQLFALQLRSSAPRLAGAILSLTAAAFFLRANGHHRPHRIVHAGNQPTNCGRTTVTRESAPICHGQLRRSCAGCRFRLVSVRVLFGEWSLSSCTCWVPESTFRAIRDERAAAGQSGRQSFGRPRPAII